MKRLNLTFDARLISSSGIGVYVQNILNSELWKQYDLKLLYKADDKEYFEPGSAGTTYEQYEAALYSVNELLKSPSKTKGADIFWSPHYNVPVINHAARLKVVTIHDVFHLAYYDTLSAVQKVYARLMVRHAVKNSDLIFTVSEFSKQEIIRFTLCSPSKIKVVHNGVNFERFNSRVEGDGNPGLSTRYNIPENFVLFVGNVKPHKNLKNALLGFKSLLLRHPDFRGFRFLIVGRREGFITGDQEIDRLLADEVLKQSVQFTGWVHNADLPGIYQKAKLFVFPSVYEGFGFPPIEAMAAGCPVISSSAACMPEIYEDAVEYFNPHKPDEIANSMFKVLSNNVLRISLIDKGYIQARKYNWNTSVTQHVYWISEALSKT